MLTSPDACWTLSKQETDEQVIKQGKPMNKPAGSIIHIKSYI